MQVQVDRSHSFAVVRPIGSFYGGSETDELERKLGGLIDDGVQIVVVDLARTHDLNSSAIGVLVGSYRRAFARNASLCLCGADQALQNVLAILKLVNVLPVYDRVESALAAVAPQPGGWRPAGTARVAAPLRRS